MGTITDKLNKLAETKSAIKTAIVNKGVSISDSDTFASYADKISSISGGGGTPTEGIYGVFIYDTNGNLTKPEEWDTANNDLAVGVAVIDENCSFVVGSKNEQKVWSDLLKGVYVEGIPTFEADRFLYSYYDGETYSSIVRGLTSGEDNAFNWAYNNTITVNGTTLYGYIGALGEWQTVLNNKAAVDNALNKIGGGSIDSSDYWTSCQANLNAAHYVQNASSFGYYPKSAIKRCKPFFHLRYPNSKVATKFPNGNILVCGSNYTIPEGGFKHIMLDGNRAHINLDSFEYNTDSNKDILYMFTSPSYSSSTIQICIRGGNITINAPNCRLINYLFGNMYALNLEPLTININASESIYDIQRLLYNYAGEVNLNVSNISNITDFSYLFYNNSLITKIKELDTSGGTNFDGMFSSCKKLIKIASISLKSLNTKISYSYFTGYSNMDNLRYALLKDFGTGQRMTDASFIRWVNWGIEDETVPLSAGARQSLIDTLITYSYDRATAGYSTCTITLHADTKALLTEDEIAQITAKGYTLA